MGSQTAAEMPAAARAEVARAASAIFKLRICKLLVVCLNWARGIKLSAQILFLPPLPFSATPQPGSVRPDHPIPEDFFCLSFFHFASRSHRFD